MAGLYCIESRVTPQKAAKVIDAVGQAYEEMNWLYELHVKLTQADGEAVRKLLMQRRGLTELVARRNTLEVEIMHDQSAYGHGQQPVDALRELNVTLQSNEPASVLIRKGLHRAGARADSSDENPILHIYRGLPGDNNYNLSLRDPEHEREPTSLDMSEEPGKKRAEYASRILAILEKMRIKNKD